MKFPLMTRKEHNEIMSEKNLAFRRYRAADKKMYEERAYKIRTGLRRTLDGFVSVGTTHATGDVHAWRLVVDIDPRPIVFPLEPGDDESAIDMIGEEVRYKVVRELKSLNVQRPEDLDLKDES